MTDIMMEYLKIKKEIAEEVSFNEIYSSNVEQLNWITTLSKISSMEPSFLILTLDETKYLVGQLKHRNRLSADWVYDLKLQMKQKIEEYAKRCFQNRKIQDDYFEKISLIYQPYAGSEFTSTGILNQAKLDYTNMEALLNGQTEKLIGKESFLATFNYTRVLFSNVYEENPELLMTVREIASDGLLVNKDRKFRKFAKTIIKTIDSQTEKKNQKMFSKKN